MTGKKPRIPFRQDSFCFRWKRLLTHWWFEFSVGCDTLELLVAGRDPHINVMGMLIRRTFFRLKFGCLSTARINGTSMEEFEKNEGKLTTSLRRRRNSEG